MSVGIFLSRKKWQGSVSGYNLGTQMLTAQISLISRAVDQEESSGTKDSQKLDG